ncbi:amino acid permease [Desulfomonile tiedjei]|uniref:Amino acid transporter n=1 Tax=Desulfomonile tiedjei (strain ATCC 49306 / DSM 6799 / DCB-1) TaxID=706587 RepID=I4C4V3_DESTA|nr:amino acid permease [Desulfomonile tiedjei]AFM24594.1 amino acid transporter [Desulfomonile tiedjei DSM 6799]
MNIWHKKSIQELQEEAVSDIGLRKVLNAQDLIMMGIGAIVGAGIFVLTGQAAAKYAGPAIVLSFVFAGGASAFTGLCYAEFASMIPISGSAYTYAYATMGQMFAWFIGWDLLLEYSIGAAAVSIGWSGYFVSLLNQIGIHIPPQFTAAFGTEQIYLSGEHLERLQLPFPPGWYELNNYSAALKTAGISLEDLPRITAVCNLPAFFIVSILTALLVKGIRESAFVNGVIVVLKLAVIVIVIVTGIAFVNTSNWTPFIPPNSGKFGEFGWSGILRGAAVVFFAYVGFDAVSTAAQESRNPSRDMPIGIIGSLIVCTVLYVLMGLVITGIVPYSKLNVADPVAVAMDVIGIHWLAIVVKLGAIAGLTSVILILLLSQPRIVSSIARDRLLPSCFARIHPRFGTPVITTILSGFVVGLIAALAPLDVLGELVSVGTLAAFIVVCAAVLILRHKQPNAPRPFRTPWVPWVPLAGICFCLYLFISLPYDAWLRLVSWLLIGLAIYFFYGAKRAAQ